jgi:hypothetical protein
MSLPTNTTGPVAEVAAPSQEAVMGKAIPSQHPAVVLRSHFKLVRALLAIAMIAVVALTVAVVILANDGDEVTGTSTAAPVEELRYGGFNPATGRPESGPLPQQEVESLRHVHSPGQRYDGGPEEGTQGIVPAPAPAPESAQLPQRKLDGTTDTSRYDGGPEEGTSGLGK